MIKLLQLLWSKESDTQDKIERIIMGQFDNSASAINSANLLP